jgi:Cell wall-active antibiotics response 4TMS YvqF
VLTADLAEPSAQPVRLDGGRVISGVFGPARRDGRWVVPETLSVTAAFGEVELDFTQAILQARHVQLYATVIGGRLRLVVPDGVTVAVTAHLALGRRRGEIIVRTPPRSRRFRLPGRRRPISRS